jgi:hypothetical protein
MATFAESAVLYTTGQLLQANTELANAQTVLKLALDSRQVVVGDADYFTLKNKVNSAKSFVETVQLQLDSDNAALAAERAPPPPPLPLLQPIPPTSDTAANKVNNETIVPVTNPVPELTATEQANLAQSKIPVTDSLTETIAPQSRLSEVNHTPPKQAAQPTATKVLSPLLNPLHDYSSYTYGLSLALLTTDEYNRIVDNSSDYVPERVIIASAGRFNGTSATATSPGTPGNFKRAAYFDEDFYFDSLNMTTVVGLNDHSRASNAVSFNFTIIEPYGVTLLNRIIELSTLVKSFNYIAQPYLLQIDFFGTNDAGEIVGAIPNQTKRMPIRIVKMDIKASPKGAEYLITATPYNHSAFDLGTVSTPANFEITAGTIAGFFRSIEAETFVTQVKNQRESIEMAAQRASGLYSRSNDTGVSQRIPNRSVIPGSAAAEFTKELISDPIYKVKSYGTAINAWFADLAATGKTSVADEYYFNFHDDIKNTKFKTSIETLSSAQTAMANTENGMTIRGGANVGLLYDVRVFAINAGTSIDQVITFAMRHTEYLQGQIRLATEFPDAVAYNAYLMEQNDTPLKWFKIIPMIKLGAYNISTETWSRQITYNIIPYTVYNSKIADAPRGIIKSPVKVHNYWYTGKNNDVLDFNIEFNALYYTAVTAYRENISKLYNLSEDPTSVPVLSAAQLEEKRANQVTPMATKAIVNNTQRRPTGGDITTIASALADVEASLYTSAGGDMLQARLKIIGDPQYIKQDDIFYSPILTTTATQIDNTGSDSRLIANGSLHMDTGELYIQMTVRSPVDIDESTGMMRFDGPTQTSLFSGMYRVLKIESTFTGGKFEQMLDIVRLPRQTTLDYTVATVAVTSNRDKSGVLGVNDNVDIMTTAKSISKTTGDDIAPGSAPVIDTVAPIQTPEAKALANVNATAEEKPIDKPTEPVATPSPVPPSAEKLALQERADQARAARDQAQRAANSVSDSIVELDAQIEQIQANIDRIPGRVARGVLTQAEADPLIAQQQASLAFKNNLLSEKQRNFAPLDAANKAAQTAYVNALDAYSRAV